MKKKYRIKKSRSLLKNRIFWYGILLFVFFTLITYLFIFSPVFQVKEVVVVGNESVESEQILQKMTFGNILFFETKNIFLIDSKKTADDILAEFPIVNKVNIKRWINKVSIVISEKNEVAIWCGNVCFSVDSNGKIFEENSEPHSITIYTPNRVEALIGDTVVNTNAISFIEEFQERAENLIIFKDNNLTIPEFYIDSENTVRARTLEGWNIYLNMQKDIEWQITKIETVFLEELSQEKRENLKYIDVRFGDQVYLKYND